MCVCVCERERERERAKFVTLNSWGLVIFNIPLQTPKFNRKIHSRAGEDGWRCRGGGGGGDLDPFCFMTGLRPF